MLSVKIDEAEVKELCRQRITDLVKEVEGELVFWDAAELKKRTCMSWNSIQEHFFFDPRFPKHKVGGKWYFSARETRTFLEQWLRERPCAL
ncbi:group-specific protein [Paenibacillus anseongense]|uniref:group-specific protein n=1 Tax=Paenibacillus anseongense TaxID=2682845 RepID=UPI002DB9E860|nr:group-specific protein [Paenibacillus anseongense]MEC0269083.1 group-specific protein [Paenibacillus anseongense]